MENPSLCPVYSDIYTDILSFFLGYGHVERDDHVDVGVADMEDTASVLRDDDGYAVACVLGQFHVHENPHQHVVSRTADALEEHLLGLAFGKTAVGQYLNPVLEDGDKWLRDVPVIVDERIDESLVHAVEIK